MSNREQPASNIHALRERMRALADAEQRKRARSDESDVLPSPPIEPASTESIEPASMAPAPIEPALVEPALVTPPPPPPQPSFDEVLDEILTNLALGQLDIATRRFASIPDLRTAKPMTWKRKILVGELVRIASSIQPMLLRHLTSAIRADELSTTKRFHSYARTYPDRAYLERAIIQRMAPHIAIAIGDALLAEQFEAVAEGSAGPREPEPAPSQAGAWVLRGLVLVGICVIVATLLVLTKPSSNRYDRVSAPAPMGAPEVDSQIVVPVNEEPRDLAQLSVMVGMAELVRRDWIEPVRLDEFDRAVMNKDCTTSQEMAASVAIRATAPERARQVLAALSVRLDRLCAPRKRSLLE